MTRNNDYSQFNSKLNHENLQKQFAERLSMNRRIKLKNFIKAQHSPFTKELSAFYRDNCQSKNALKASKSPQIKVYSNDRNRPNSATGAIKVVSKGKDSVYKNSDCIDINKQNQPPQINLNIKEQPKRDIKCQRVQHQIKDSYIGNQRTYMVESLLHNTILNQNKPKNTKPSQTRKKDIYLFNQHQVNKSKSPAAKNKSSHSKVIAKKSNSSQKEYFAPVLQRKDLDKCQIHIISSKESREDGEEQDDSVSKILAISRKIQVPQAKYYIDTSYDHFLCCQECFIQIKNNLPYNAKVNQVAHKQKSLGTHNSLNSKQFRTVQQGVNDRSQDKVNLSDYRNIVKQIQIFQNYRKNLEKYQSFFTENLKRSHNVHSQYYKMLKEIIDQAQKNTQLQLSRFTNQQQGKIQNMFIQIDKNINILKSASNKVMCISADVNSKSENIYQRVKKQINSLCKNVLVKVNSNVVAINQQSSLSTQNASNNSLRIDFSLVSFEIQDFRQQISKFQQIFNAKFYIQIVHAQEVSIIPQSKKSKKYDNQKIDSNEQQSINNNNTIINNLSLNRSFVDSVQQSPNESQILSFQNKIHDQSELQKQKSNIQKSLLQIKTEIENQNQKKYSFSDIGTIDLFCDQQIEKKSQSQASNSKRKAHKYEKNLSHNLGGSLNYNCGIGQTGVGKAMYFSFERNPQNNKLHDYVIMETNQQDSATTSPVFKQI